MIFGWKIKHGDFISMLEPKVRKEDLTSTKGVVINKVWKEVGPRIGSSVSVRDQVHVVINDNFVNLEANGLWRLPAVADKMVAIVDQLGLDAKLRQVRFNTRTNCWHGFFNL